MSHKIFLAALAALAAAAGVACRSAGAPPPIVQPGAPGESTRVIGAAQAADLSKVGHTDADVKFMQGMIHHHAQAIDMVNLLKTRTAHEEMRKLGLRIELSQDDEIKMMRRWLEVRGQEVPGEHAHHQPGAPLMPGMLTPQEMETLAAAKGAGFDRLFLELMIKHHEGAVIMVDELFASPGAGQDSEIFQFASDVVADQRAEIDRMGAMLATLKEFHQ
ncbi:MAG: DUF305 domain-containing protein [Acidobacteria bacterium]|nr:DUF305 domain-containing protein [Acidobacteriota bacterium]